MNRPFLKAGYCGIILLIVSAVLLAVNPSKAVKMPEGFITPVVAFEFIKSGDEVYDLFGKIESPAGKEIVISMETGTYIDFLYMAVYTLFLLLFVRTCYRITNSRWYIFPGIAAVIIPVSDFSENMQLLYIMNNLNSGDFGNSLFLLNIWTWVKWGGLSLLFISLVPFFRNKGILGGIISAVSVISAILGSAAFFHRSVINEIYVLSIAVIFLLMIVFSFIFKIDEKSELSNSQY